MWKEDSANFALTEFQDVYIQLRMVASCLWWKGLAPRGFSKQVGKERTMKKSRTARRKEQPPFGAQVAFARVATGLGWTSLGALAIGASAAGAVAIGALAIRALAVKRGRIQRLDIEELEVGRLHVRELVVEQEQTPSQGASVEPS
jgi:hypothetical protein